MKVKLLTGTVLYQLNCVKTKKEEDGIYRFCAFTSELDSKPGNMFIKQNIDATGRHYIYVIHHELSSNFPIPQQKTPVRAGEFNWNFKWTAVTSCL